MFPDNIQPLIADLISRLSRGRSCAKLFLPDGATLVRDDLEGHAITEIWLSRKLRSMEVQFLSVDDKGVAQGVYVQYSLSWPDCDLESVIYAIGLIEPGRIEVEKGKTIYPDPRPGAREESLESLYSALQLIMKEGESVGPNHRASNYPSKPPKSELKAKSEFYRMLLTNFTSLRQVLDDFNKTPSTETAIEVEIALNSLIGTFNLYATALLSGSRPEVTARYLETLKLVANNDHIALEEAALLAQQTINDHGNSRSR